MHDGFNYRAFRVSISGIVISAVRRYFMGGCFYPEGEGWEIQSTQGFGGRHVGLKWSRLGWVRSEGQV